MMEINPCKVCEKHTPTCHSTCEDYKLWREKWTAYKKEIDIEKGKSRELYEYFRKRKHR